MQYLYCNKVLYKENFYEYCFTSRCRYDHSLQSESRAADAAVRRALESEAICPQGGRILLVAVGKAAWQMAHTAVAALGRVDEGIVITKYGHVRGTIPGVTCYEAGHPVPDESSFAATEKVLTMVQNLTDQDTVLFLLSGGGSALFEKPLIPGAELQEITNSLLAAERILSR